MTSDEKTPEPMAAEGSGGTKRSFVEPAGVQIPPRPPQLIPRVAFLILHWYSTQAIFDGARLSLWR